jgi:tripartite ATP-independent transporter DctM subunit
MDFLGSPGTLLALLFVGVCGALLVGYPVAFTLAGGALLFGLGGAGMGLIDLSFLTALPQRMFAVMSNEVLVAVPLFVFMGVMLERSRIAEELLENMGRLFRNLPGGLGISVFAVGALLAASTGIVGATVVTMGLLSLPTMLRRGYDPSLACGTICAAGTLGQIIPPSIVLVLLGDQLATAYQRAQYQLGNFAPDTVSVNDLFAGALIPGLVLVGLYMLFQLVVAVLHPDKAPAISTNAHSDAVGLYVGLTRSLLAPVGLIVAVLGSILVGLASPTEAASVGAVGALLLAGSRLEGKHSWTIVTAVICFGALIILARSFDLRMQRSTVTQSEWLAITGALFLAMGLTLGVAVSLVRTLRHRDTDGGRVLVMVMRRTMMVSAMVFMILIGASMFSLSFRAIGGDTFVEDLLLELPGGALTVVFVVMLTMFLLGFFLDFLEIMFIVVPVVAPVLLSLEISPGVLISPVWLGIMIAVNLQTSFLTPPFGFSLFYLRGVAPGSVKTSQIYIGVIPFVVIQMLMLLVLWFFPQLATWLPGVLYAGH